MRVFLCSYTGFSVAIPMNCVASLIMHKTAAEQTVKNDSINNNTFISLPLLFHNPRAVIRHGIILKKENDDVFDNADDGFKNKTILLTTEVECEKEIPEEKIYPVPKILSVFDFSVLFNGISINPIEAQAVILFLNTKEFFDNIEAKLNSKRKAA